ncbi:MAG: aldo/keto reductase [Rhodobacteraceae bacterium]|nr:aldo/keto reductase [Paracoccaceae bacterium]
MNLIQNQLGQSGLTVSSLGVGSTPFGGMYTTLARGDAEATLTAALDAGITYVDTAPFYGFGLSERLVGDVIRGRNTTLSTKVGRLLKPGLRPDPGAEVWANPLPFHQIFDYSYDAIMRSVDDSFQRLGVDRIDILYVHDIGEMTHGADNVAHFETLRNSGYRALDQLRADGTVKAIGLGVNEVAICREALNIGNWDAFLLAGRYTLLEQSPLDNLLPECAASNTSMVIGGPYNSGILVSGDRWNYDAAPADIQQRVAALTKVSADFNIPLPAAALQFPLAHPVVASAIPGLRSVAEVEATLNWSKVDIPPEFWAALKAQNLLHPDAPVPMTNPYWTAA